MRITMKKLQVLIPAADREVFLDKLGTVGVVHIEERVGVEGSSDLEKIDAAIKRSRQVLDALNKISQKPPASIVSSHDSATSIIEKYFSCISRKEQLLQEKTALQKDAAVLSLWGTFDPDLINKLEHSGIQCRYFETSAKKFRTLDLSEIPCAIIRQDTIVRFMTIDRNQPTPIDADEVVLPRKSLKAINQTIDEYDKEIITIDNEITALSLHTNCIEQQVQKLKNDAQFETARINLESTAHGRILLLTGWLPVSRQKEVSDFLMSQTVWFEFRYPQNDEVPPVLLKNNKYSSKFEPITNMFALPSYFELDPTPFFAPFFMFFFSLCLGDVGYGMIVFIAALTLFIKGSPKIRPISVLGIFLGLSTMITGLFLNSFFGTTLFDTIGVKGLAGPGGMIPFLGSQVINGKTEFPTMTFAIYIGAVQMLLGMFLQMINKFRQSGFIYAIQPFCYIPITIVSFIWLCKVNFLNMGSYAINSLFIGKALASTPNILLYTLLVIGIVPFVFFNTPTMKIYWRPLKFIWDFYNFINSMVSYGLSYLRLFALGLAGGLLGNAFNQIALMIITDVNGVVDPRTPAIIFTILIMVAGHALNFGLSALGAFVHTVRLTFVEFYGSLSFTGGGKRYNPFTGKSTIIK